MSFCFKCGETLSSGGQASHACSGTANPTAPDRPEIKAPFWVDKILELEKQNAELRAWYSAACDCENKLRQECYTVRAAFETSKLAYATLREACEQALKERDGHAETVVKLANIVSSLQVELKQTDERAQFWIAEAARLRENLAHYDREEGK